MALDEWDLFHWLTRYFYFEHSPQRTRAPRELGAILIKVSLPEIPEIPELPELPEIPPLGAQAKLCSLIIDSPALSQIVSINMSKPALPYYGIDIRT